MVSPVNIICGCKGLLVEGTQGSIQSNIQIAKGVNISNNIQKNFPNHFSKRSLIFFHIKVLLQQSSKNYFKRGYNWFFKDQSIKSIN